MVLLIANTMKLRFDKSRNDWVCDSDIIDVLRNTYGIYVEAYSEFELFEIVKEKLKAELREKI